MIKSYTEQLEENIADINSLENMLATMRFFGSSREDIGTVNNEIADLKAESIELLEKIGASQ